MRILILSQYYYPEAVGAAIWVRQLAEGLCRRGHVVGVITALPNYPSGVVMPEYRRCWFRRESVGPVQVRRSWIYSSSSKSFGSRLLAFASFCVSCLGWLFSDLARFDAMYIITPPMPLGISGWLLAWRCRSKVVLNIQDIYPDVAVELGILRRPLVIRFFKAMAALTYRIAGQIVVISEGFRDSMLAKGVPEAKLHVVANWTDLDALRPRSRDNKFRGDIAPGREFLLVYSGGLTHNSNLDPLIEAARTLADTPFKLAIVGEGVRKQHLDNLVATYKLRNVVFLPFQSLERYPDVLAAADMTAATLHAAATFASVPSKIYKQMAAGRPILAITGGPNELTRLVEEANCGVAVPAGDLEALVRVLRDAMARPDYYAQLGLNGRLYAEGHCSIDLGIDKIEELLTRVTRRQPSRSTKALAPGIPVASRGKKGER